MSDAGVRTVDAQLAVALRDIEPLHALDVPLLDAQGCILADDVVASVDVPRFDHAAVDGYAVRLADVVTASDAHPVVLPVVGDVAVGRAPVVSVQQGFAARVMAGAPIPPGTEAVVAEPFSDGGIARVELRRAPGPGEGIKPVGSDVRSGEVLLRAGELIGAGHLGLLAAIGRSRATVRPRPRVVVLSTGDELVEPGGHPEPGQMFEANSYVLTAQAKEAGALAYRVGIVPDDPRRLVDAVEDQLVRADLVVTTGGTSDRAYAEISEVLTAIGTVSFDHLAMRPGATQGHGVIGPDATPIFTLPGDPVGSFVSFEVFVRPVIRRMLGLEPLGRSIVRAVSVGALVSEPGARDYVRATLDVADGRYVVRPHRNDGVRGLVGVDSTNALIVLPESTTYVSDGDAVEVMVLERRNA